MVAGKNFPICRGFDMNAVVEQFGELIVHATERRRPIRIRGSGAKDFYGGPLRGEVLEVGAYRGVVDYAPEELVMTACAGTPLSEIENILAERGQMLPFEPPHFGPRATLGGCIASGLSGPRRANAGAVRDFLLGVEILNGRGERLRFGGQVMKNVAGYDVARLMAGSLGTLGLILQASLKVLPRPAAEATLQFELDEAQALSKMRAWAAAPLPISATCYHDQVLTLRLSGAQSAVQAARKNVGGQMLIAGEEFWRSIREQTSHFFHDHQPLWRISLPASAAFDFAGKQLMEWNGALRWLYTELDAASLRAKVEGVGGHATLFRSAEKTAPAFHPLPLALLALHKRMKQAFDPQGIFNPGRMHPEF